MPDEGVLPIRFGSGQFWNIKSSIFTLYIIVFVTLRCPQTTGKITFF